MEQLDIQQLIREITPLYNLYKQSSRKIKGTDALYIMWDIGNLLKNKIEKSNIAPHNLYRKIYGKAEGKNDITQKSYITREFLSRSYRIRNMFNSKVDIKNDLPDLNNFISFREAMPFFDNDKYILKGDEKKKLLSILNSQEKPSLILKKINLLQAEKIGIKNPRDQKLKELESQKDIFISFYNYLLGLIKNNDYVSLRKKISTIDDSVIIKLSSATNVLAQEGLRFQGIPEVKLDGYWKKYVDFIIYFSKQTDAKERRRLRRLVPPERIVRLAEMLQSITSEILFNKIK